jgi:hypothetical protein
MFFLLEKHSTLNMGEFLLWATVEFAVAGWMVNKIQKEKSANSENTDETENPQ